MQVARLEDGKRKVVSVQEINGMEGDVVTMSELFRFERKGLDEDGNVSWEACGRPGSFPLFTATCSARASNFPIEVFGH